jgi:restriction endonuclease S subunit
MFWTDSVGQEGGWHVMATKKIRIIDCADVRPGYSAKGAIANDPEGSLHVVIAQHVTKGEPYRYVDEHSLLITPPKFYDKYLVVPGDILFMSRGSNNYAVLVESVPQPAIAPLTFFIIRPKENVIPSYLAWCLDQDVVKAQLNEIRTGVGTPMIPSNAFRDITIPLPSLDVQRHITDLSRLQTREKLLLQQLVEETERRQQATNKKIIFNFNNLKQERT